MACFQLIAINHLILNNPKLPSLEAYKNDDPRIETEFYLSSSEIETQEWKYL